MRNVCSGMGMRFNEAEAIKPRNLPRVRLRVAGAEASMRPRQSSLGIASTLIEIRTLIKQLQ